MRDPGEPLASVVTVAFTSREWSMIERIADRAQATPTAVVRAAVKQTLASPGVRNLAFRAEPKDVTPTARSARVFVNKAGRRLCPVCLDRELVRKNPRGPGRYPGACDWCKAAGRG